MYIKTKTNDQKTGVAGWPQKLYTQNEVDALLEKKEDIPFSQAGETAQETQAAGKQKRLDSRTVANLVKKSNRILVGISSHAFPFDFFPDAINVEESRVTVINRQLLSSAVHSVDIKDISNVLINTVPFFAQLVIVSKTFEENEVRIRNLKPKEAVFVRRIIEGLRIFENKQVDTSGYTTAELVVKLEQLSTTEIVT